VQKGLGVTGKRKLNTDKIFKIGATIAGAYVLVIIALMVFELLSESYPVWQEEGISFITGTDWNPVEGRESFGALPYILGTLVTATLAMAIGVPLSIGIAMFLSDSPKSISEPLGFMVELLAAVPSVIYGLWGLFVFRNYFKDWIEVPLHNTFGDSVWFFSGTPFGLDIFTASIILAIMIIPTVSAVSREIMKAVPQQQKEAAYMLGATRWEMFKLAIFPYSKTGLLAHLSWDLVVQLARPWQLQCLLEMQQELLQYHSRFSRQARQCQALLQTSLLKHHLHQCTFQHLLELV